MKGGAGSPAGSLYSQTVVHPACFLTVDPPPVNTPPHQVLSTHADSGPLSCWEVKSDPVLSLATPDSQVITDDGGGVNPHQVNSTH